MKDTKPTRKREQLDWNQIDFLARTVSVDLMGDKEEAMRVLMILMQEIAENPFDHSHVETITNLLLHHLFASTVEADVAFKTFIARERQKLTEKGDAR
jgi:hypothetical protein